ncbi:MAG: ABC transporter permease [Pyrinomonadaceae bacterium]
MKTILRLMWIYVLLIVRLPVSLLFNVIIPLVFFLFYAVLVAHASGPAVGGLLVRMVTLGALSNGLFGLSISLVVLRERDILRRYHLSPISAFHLVVSRLLANYLLFLGVTLVELGLAKVMLGFEVGPVLLPLLLAFSLGYLSIAGIGFLIASIVNNVNDAQVYNQLTFFGLLFLSGIAIPLSSMPVLLQRFAAFIPSALTVVAANEVVKSAPLPWPEMLCLAVISLVTLGVSTVMFRWEKEAKAQGRDRLKAAVILVPLILAGVWLNTAQGFTQKISMTTENLRSPLQQLAPKGTGQQQQ